MTNFDSKVTELVTYRGQVKNRKEEGLVCSFIP